MAAITGWSRPTCSDVGVALGISAPDALSTSTIIVTGGSHGIGAETMQFLAMQGATVIIASRKRTAAEAAIAAAREKAKRELKIFFLPLDLSSLSSIQAFAEAFTCLTLKENLPPLDTLILNAGIMRMGMPGGMAQASGTDIEMTFAVNHLGGFSLTQLLLPKLRQAAAKGGRGGRVVVLSSGSHKGPYNCSNIEDKNLLVEKVVTCKTGYGGLGAYGSSKMCNVLFAQELQRREVETGVVCCSLHPGALIGTSIAAGSNFAIRGFFSFASLFTKSCDQGAATTVYCSLLPPADLQGKYFDSCEEATISSNATTAAAAVLWDLSWTLYSNGWDVAKLEL